MNIFHTKKGEGYSHRFCSYCTPQREGVNVKGAIIFYREGGGRLSVMAGRQFFLVPPFAYGK